MRLLLVLFTGLLLLLGSCSDDNSGTDSTSATTITLSFNGLETLGNGFHYEGWVVLNGAPVSTGKFNLDANGSLVDLSGASIANEFSTANNADLAGATTVIITIEPSGDTDDVPAATKIIAGDISGSSATLNTSHGATLGNDFSSATGSFILATPTNGADSDENSGIWFLNPPSTTFVMDFTGLDPLLNGFHYEGWAIVDGSPVTTGKFNVDASGNLVNLDGTAISNNEFTVGGNLSTATAIVLTIEPDGDTDDIPAATHLLAGDVSTGNATLSIGHASALGDDFSGAMGDFILATPTDTVTTNENSGIWFLSLASGSPAQGLTLPTLPAGWVYEGWAVIDGVPVTTGTFTDLAAIDNEAPYSGSGSGPPFPGEDFLNNAPAGLTFPTDLAGATAVISIEPFPDDSDTPFTLKPLVQAIDAAATDHVTYSMGNNSSAFPAGTVTITVTGPTAGLNLPTLPSGWVYEGWAVIDGVPVTTGTFTDLAAADNAAPYSGAEPAPAFPGEDFLMNQPSGVTFPTDLAGKTAVISIEPDPDDNSAPFTLKPLVQGIDAAATDHVTYSMGNNAANFPTGSAAIK